MKLDYKFSFYSIISQINWVLLWISIARFAYSIGDIDCARYAREKGNTAYRKARQLLAQAHIDKEERRSVVDDLQVLQFTLEQLFAEPAGTWERSCST